MLIRERGLFTKSNEKCITPFQFFYCILCRFNIQSYSQRQEVGTDFIPNHIKINVQVCVELDEWEIFGNI